MEKYVVGFLFNKAQDHVVLIEKNKPEFQKGKLNGVGGKIEQGELPIDAMRREFGEEAGVSIYNWSLDVVITSDNCIIHCYSATAFDQEWAAIRSMEEEKIGKYSVASIHLYHENFIMTNLRFLMPLALSKTILKPVHFFDSKAK